MWCNQRDGQARHSLAMMCVLKTSFHIFVASSQQHAVHFCAVDPQPQTSHGEYRDSNRLEDRALLVLGPTAKAAPDGRENARKTGEAAENAVQKAHAGIRRDAASLDGLHRRSGEAIRAVEH